MRLTDCQIQAICQLARELAGGESRVRVFGSRLDDTAHGGDLDLMLELSEPVDNPAFMSAQMSARVSCMGVKWTYCSVLPTLYGCPFMIWHLKKGGCCDSGSESCIAIAIFSSSPCAKNASTSLPQTSGCLEDRLPWSNRLGSKKTLTLTLTLPSGWKPLLAGSVVYKIL